MGNYVFEDCQAVKLIKINKKLEDEGLQIGDVGVVMLEERYGYLLVSFDGFIYKDRHGEWATALPDIDVAVSADYIAPATDEEHAEYFKKQKNKWRETASEEEKQAFDAFEKKYGNKM